MSAIGTEMSPYPDVPNPDLLERIPQTARVVLDVGCGTGALGAAYRRINPKAILLGIEMNEASARQAARRLDEVILGDAESLSLPDAWHGKIDCLVYGDTLEHFRDPAAVLHRHVAALSPDGVVLASIPNVEHWSLLAQLIRTGWRYEATGLRDEKHLRWFSYETMRELLDQSGLFIVDAHARVFERERVHQFVADLAPTLASHGIDRDAFSRRVAPIQYVWRATKQPLQPIFLVMTMLTPVGGVSHVRVLEPMRALASIPGVMPMLWNSRDPLSVEGPVPKLLILHRPALVGAKGLNFLRQALAQNFLIITEFDDHPDYIPVLQRQDMYNFKAVHAVQTTTEGLADVLRQANPEVGVFPNAVQALPDIRNFAHPDKFTLLFAALNRENDWAPYIDGLNVLAQEFREKLQFAIVHDRGLFDALQTPYKNFLPLLEYNQYLDLLSRCEICFIPLRDNPFNRCKSDLKFLEASAHRVVSVASPTVYSASLRDGETGFLFRSSEELITVIRRIVANPDLGPRVGNAARQWVAQNRMLAYQMSARVAWYRALWERRQELTESLLQRVPELRLI
ncbi:MAG: methyltransferase domain-containing protein [Acidobacteriia bacterium]|nr:methyltransferase domain-containing protein [Methyloceanibacter sp.]MCL6491394.1 methyltransferase domain-containing protein [Terriglobia bacterium]